VEAEVEQDHQEDADEGGEAQEEEHQHEGNAVREEKKEGEVVEEYKSLDECYQAKKCTFMFHGRTFLPQNWFVLHL